VIVLIVVAIPDGLPVTIGVSLAFSVNKMFKQKILVRNLEAPEKMGGIQEICCGKTGTLTKNEMKVTQFYTENRPIINNRKDTLLKCELGEETLGRITESILYNCDARVEMDDVIYKPVGNGTEVGLLKLLQDADIPIHILINKKHGNVLMRSPHSSETKRSAVAIKSPDRPGMVSIYVKGAPEMLINHCNKLVIKDNVQEMGPNETTEILKRVNTMAMQPLRVIGMAYLELNTDQYE
jgi:magnesium-transporting ATPase (P-type)